MEQIIQHGSVTRGWIGAGVQELTPELAESFKLGDIKGVLVTEVISRSPADQAGIKTGDILTTIDSTAIDNWSAMLETVANLPPGKAVSIRLMRNGEALSLQVKIGKRPKPVAQ
jgi:serine protease DegQ